MVLQGAMDPLNDARARAAALDAACSNVEVQLIAGGHCPVCACTHQLICQVIALISSNSSPHQVIRPLDALSHWSMTTMCVQQAVALR